MLPADRQRKVKLFGLLESLFLIRGEHAIHKFLGLFRREIVVGCGPDDLAECFAGTMGLNEVIDVLGGPLILELVRV